MSASFDFLLCVTAARHRFRAKYRIHFKNGGHERRSCVGGGSVYILKHGVGEAAGRVVQAYECPNLAGAEGERAGVDDGELLAYRGEFDFVVGCGQRLIGRGHAKAQIADGGTDSRQCGPRGHDVDVGGSQVRRGVDQANLEITRSRCRVVIGEDQVRNG